MTARRELTHLDELLDVDLVGIADGQALVRSGAAWINQDIASQPELDAHIGSRLNVHGISDATQLVYTTDARLSDQRVPTDGSVTDAKVAANAAIAYSKLALAGNIKLTDLNFTPTTLTASGTFLARNQVGSNTLTFATRAASDIQDRFQFDSSGKLQWGTGALATDINLYRGQTGKLRTDGEIQAKNSLSGAACGFSYVPATAVGNAFRSIADVDVNSRFVIDYSGKHQWGDGTNAVDTNLYRSGSGTLRTDTTFLAATFQANPATSTSNAIQTKVIGDAQIRLLIDASGKHQWGDGTNPTDTNLYRAAASVLKTDGQFQAVGSGSAGFRYVPNTASGTAFYSQAAVDALGRFVLYYDGKLEWGDGTNARDTNLYRVSASQLKTDGSFSAAANISIVGTGAFIARSQPSSSQLTYVSRLATDTTDRFQLQADGSMAWGNGASAADVFMSRGGTNILNLGSSTQKGTFYIFGDSAPNTALKTFVTTDTNPRFAYSYDGKIQWGSGTGVADTFLYRSAAGVLKTDGQFYITGVATFQNSLSVGQLVTYNKTLDPGVAGANQARTYLRDNGSGKMQLVVQMPTGTPIVLATEA